MPQRELRALFEQLNLEISFQPGEHALDVALTLCDERGDGQSDQAPQICGGLTRCPRRDPNQSSAES